MLPESLRTALGTVIAQCRREWRREHELIGAQAREVMAQAREAVAEFRARMAEVDAIARDQVTARLAAVREGTDGAPGRDGLDGAPGRDGTDGAPGRDGVDGRDGCSGRDGIDGKDGASGRDGSDGAPGHDGLDGKDGEPGRNGADSAPGRDGVDGKDGAPGLDGDDGAPGRDGLDGQDGAPGRDGADGKDGVPGRDGSDGAPGRDGLDGKDGAPGRLPACKAWAPGVHYEAEVRTSAGATWQAARDTAATPGDGADWVQLAAAGRDGATPRFVGTYAADASYGRHDVVALNAGSFVALSDAPGACPGSGWQLVAGPGRRGAPGQDGRDGRDSAPGPGIVSWRTDVERFTVTPVLSDESTGPALDLRDLFEHFRAATGI